MQLSGIKYTYNVVHLSLLSIYRTLSSYQAENLCPFNSYSPCALAQLLVTSILLSVSMSLSILGISNKWNQTILELSCLAWASQVAHWVKNMPAIQQTPEKCIQFLGWEDPLEEGMATHSSILAWRIP